MEKRSGGGGKRGERVGGLESAGQSSCEGDFGFDLGLEEAASCKSGRIGWGRGEGRVAGGEFIRGIGDIDLCLLHADQTESDSIQLRVNRNLSSVIEHPPK